MAVSFVQEAVKYTEIEFCVILGKETSRVIKAEDYKSINHLQFRTVAIHPSDHLLALFRFRKALSEIEKQFSPDAVITVFGPCYWKPKAPHIMGFANGYLLYEDSYFFSIWPGKRNWKYLIMKRFHRYLLRTEANFYWTETEDSMKRLALLVEKPLDHFVVSSNNCSNLFRTGTYEKHLGLPQKTKPRLLYISSYYYHKGFEIMATVLKQLEKQGVEIEMVVTIEPKEFEKLFSGVNNIINLGPVEPKYCPWLYEQSDIVFAPSLLEIFSAVYPEAMFMQKPILTTDLPFARDTCGDAALNFDPTSVADAVEKIGLLLKDEGLKSTLIANGLERLKAFDLPEERFRKVLEKLGLDKLGLDNDK